MTGEVHELPASSPPPSRASNGGGNGNGSDARLRRLEVQVARIDERVAGMQDNMAKEAQVVRIDERVAGMQDNMAKKNDVTSLKVWILGGVLCGIITVVGVAAIIVKAFF